MAALREQISRQAREIAELERENAYVSGANKRLLARVTDLENANTSLAAQIRRQQDHIWALETWQHKLDAPIATAKRVMMEVRKLHHLGAFIVDKTRTVSGTFDGYLGLHPLDYDPSASQVNVPMAPDAYIRTYDWRRTSVPTVWWYWQHTQPRGFVSPFSYPRMDLWAVVVEAYDSSPPEPRNHRCGLIEQIIQYRTNILEPHLAAENAAMEETLLRWKQRVKPFMESVAGIVEALETIVSVDDG